MKKKVLITLDQEAKESLQDRAYANGLSLSGYINLLGHASQIYHKLNSPEKEDIYVAEKQHKQSKRCKSV